MVTLTAPGQGLYAGGALAISSVAPLPTADIGYERARFGARLRVPFALVGRFALETSYALDAARRTRAYAAVGIETLVFNEYRFVGLGLERRLHDRKGWFVQLDATVGDYDEAYEEQERRAALSLAFGVRSR